MNLLAWILFGLIVGILAYALDTDRKQASLLNAVVLGMGGAFLGGLAATILFGSNLEGFNLSTFLLAMGGALVVLLFGKYSRDIRI